MKSEELNRLYQKIKSLSNAANLPLLSPKEEKMEVKLVADEKISAGLFKQSQVSPNIYYANSRTIAAVKKDIFLLGEGFEDLEDLRPCVNCGRKLDGQFWNFCPHCEGRLSK